MRWNEKRSGFSSGSSASLTESVSVHALVGGSPSKGGGEDAEATGKKVTVTLYILCGGKPCSNTSPVSFPFFLKMSKMAMSVVMPNDLVRRLLKKTSSSNLSF